jgi:hypothetical protein
MNYIILMSKMQGIQFHMIEEIFCWHSSDSKSVLLFKSNALVDKCGRTHEYSGYLIASLRFWCRTHVKLDLTSIHKLFMSDDGGLQLLDIDRQPLNIVFFCGTPQEEMTWWSGPLLCMACTSQPCFFVSILKQKNSYIVGCVQCDIWDITAHFLLPELKYYTEKYINYCYTFGYWR